MRTAPRDDEVHLWRAPLDVSPQIAARFAATLSDAEHERAGRRRRANERSRSIAGHGWLRQLLASYLDVHPAALAFDLDPGGHGKPRLSNADDSWLRFNLSHSGAIVVFAVARGRDVGVDVEEIRDDVDIDGISARLFTEDQRHQLAARPPQDRTPAFFAMWTSNEAYVKATGRGLPGTDREGRERSSWQLAPFDPGPGYAAAVAVEGYGVEIPPAAAVLSVPAHDDP